MTHFDKPNEDEYGPYDKQYVGLLPDDGDLLKHLADNLAAADTFFRSLPDAVLTSRYAEGKWTVKEVLGHIIDTERIYGYRVLRFARNDATALPGFEQDDYVKMSHANDRSIDAMLQELAAVRAASIALLRSLEADSLLRTGVASGRTLSVRAAAYILAGHQVHHVNVIKQRYL